MCHKQAPTLSAGRKPWASCGQSRTHRQPGSWTSNRRCPPSPACPARAARGLPGATHKGCAGGNVAGPPCTRTSDDRSCALECSARNERSKSAIGTKVGWPRVPSAVAHCALGQGQTVCTTAHARCTRCYATAQIDLVAAADETQEQRHVRRRDLALHQHSLLGSARLACGQGGGAGRGLVSWRRG